MLAFTTGTRDDLELEGIYCSGFETLFVSFVPRKWDLASLEKSSSNHFECFELFHSTSLNPNETLLD